ncbi:MAG: 50S ribosomal protein L10 [Gammaproteobacteria bacterium]|nr:50S ribosomal protein L10 [Gammaproteobacteria bacterium]
MPRPDKVQAVEEIRRRLTEARATFVTEYRGLTVAEQQTLRAALREADGEYKVVKMSLARLAADAEGLEGLRDVLAGPTALAFAGTDPVPVAKALRDFAKEHERLIIKGGILAGEILLPEKIARLADIEPRDVLLARVAGAFEAPMVKLAGLLLALPRDAVSMFSQLLEKKEASGESPVEKAASEVEETVATEEVSVAEEASVEETSAEETSAEETSAEEDTKADDEDAASEEE